MKLKIKSKYIHKADGYEVTIVNQVADKVTFKAGKDKHKMTVSQFLSEFEEPFKPVFKGYMKIFLGGDTAEMLFEQIERTGDWLHKPQQILGKHKKDFKGRNFQVSFYLVDTDGNLGHAVTRTLDRTSIEGLVGTVTTQGNELAGYADRLIDIRNSCAVVRA